MQALRLQEEGGAVQLDEIAKPDAPKGDEVLVRMRFVTLNHIDLFGFRGMAFAQRQPFPITVAVFEGSGEVEAVGPDVKALKPGDPVVLYPGMFCGRCRRCQAGQENLCEDIAGIMGKIVPCRRHRRPMGHGARGARDQGSGRGFAA